MMKQYKKIRIPAQLCSTELERLVDKLRKTRLAKVVLDVFQEVLLTDIRSREVAQFPKIFVYIFYHVRFSHSFISITGSGDSKYDAGERRTIRPAWTSPSVSWYCTVRRGQSMDDENQSSEKRGVNKGRRETKIVREIGLKGRWGRKRITQTII